MRKLDVVQKTLLKAKLKAIPQYLLIFIIITVVAWFTHRYIEAICLLVSFFSLRYKFSLTYHAESSAKCLTITSIIFIVSIPICLSIHTTLLFNILIGFFICYCACVAEHYNRLSRAKVEEIKPATITPQNLKKLTKEEILALCTKNNVSTRDTFIAVCYFVEHKPPRDIYELLEKQNEYMELSSLYKILSRLKVKLK